MPDLATLGLFAAAAAALIVVPGPSVAYIVAQSVSSGRRGGLVSMLGIEAGALLHVAAAAVGLSSLLAASAIAFAVVRYAGAAYLVGFGLWILLRPSAEERSGVQRSVRPGRVFWQGVAVNASNPKTTLFFLAFLPQFVDPSRGDAAVQILVLGLVFVAIAVLSDSVWALAAGTVASATRGRAALVRGRRYVTGTVMVALGVTAALSGSRRAAGP